MSKNNFKKEEVLYMGDDIPDIECLNYVGFSCCPTDASTDVIEICDYISNKKVVRVVSEMLLNKLFVLQKMDAWMELLNIKKIILGSNSPRRSNLLKSIGLSFEIRKIYIEETYPKNLSPVKIAEFLSKKNLITKKLMKMKF